MNPPKKRKGPKPIQLIRALFDCTILFCIPGLFLTFVAPSSTIELTRVNQDRVDATVIKKLLFVVPVSRHTATNLVNPESETLDGGLIREGGSPATTTGKITGEAEDEGLLFLKAAQGNPIEVSISPQNLDDIEEEIQYFITESKEASLRLRVVSNWKFGVILPGGILIFCLIVFIMAAWSIIKSKPLESEGSPG